MMREKSSLTRFLTSSGVDLVTDASGWYAFDSRRNALLIAPMSPAAIVDAQQRQRICWSGMGGSNAGPLDAQARGSGVDLLARRVAAHRRRGWARGDARGKRLDGEEQEEGRGGDT